MIKNKIIKDTENATLDTFKREVPSDYYSYEDKKSYEKFLKNFKHTYMYNYNFPPKMFHNVELIDFGAGTGHRAINFAAWGAKCTLVELSDRSSEISKKLFKSFADDYSKHKFINSSIFDYEEKNKLYDIVHCVGVLSHTAAKEDAFKKICKYLKKGGYLIFGDPNKSGGFQNMLQRYGLYKFSKNDDDVVKNSEILFKEDIDRSEKAVPRTRKEIIYDRWVIQSQDDPSFSEVCKWLKDCNLKLYSAYPTYPNFFLSDSFYNENKIDFEQISNLPVLSEIMWMTKTQDDLEFSKIINNDLSKLNEKYDEFASYVANCNFKTNIETDKFFELSQDVVDSLNKIKFIEKLRSKFLEFVEESKNYIDLVNKNDFKNVKKFVDETKLLFRGPAGIRHVDFIAYKEE